MFGIEDNWVLAAYILCIASALLCVGYGLIFWNKGDEPVEESDRTWAQHEVEAEDKV